MQHGADASRAISSSTVDKSLEAKVYDGLRRQTDSRSSPHSRYTVDSCRLGAMYGGRTVDSLGLAIIRIVLLR